MAHPESLEWRDKWRAKAWFKNTHLAKEVDHADLRRNIDVLIRQRPEDHVKVSWVKGHGLPRQISVGLTTDLDIWANNGADAFAGAASSVYG